MKSRFILLILCLVFSLASFTPLNAEENAADSEKQSAPAVEEAIPDVPENGKMADYKEYIEKMYEMLNKKAQVMYVKAQTDGVDTRSEEFIKSIKELGKEYYNRIEKAMDKALLLKDVTDAEFEELVNGKIQVLQIISKINDSDDDAFTAKVEAFLAQLRQMDKNKIADGIEFKVFQSKIVNYVQTGNVEKFAKAAAEIDNKVEKAGKDINPVLAQQAMLIVLISNDLSEYKAPEDRLEKIQKALTEAADPEVNKLAGELQNLLIRAEVMLFQNKILGYIRNNNIEEFSKAAAEIDEKIEKAGKDITPVLAQQAILIVLLSNELPEYEAPEGRLNKYAKAVSEASDPEVNKMAGDLEELIRLAEGEKRLKESLGKEFKFGGTFTDGSEFNAKDYTDKAILFFFWATWCDICRTEIPNVKRIYAAYHDKGFEIIGVTSDDPKEEEALNTFLKENEISWKQMFDGKAIVPGEKNKDDKQFLVSDYYGIYRIPCMILIGKDGKVLSLDARGKELKEQLAKIYGEVEGLELIDDDAENNDDFDDANDVDEDDQAADEAIPEVPQDGKLADYKEYVKKVNVMFSKKVKRMERQAQKDGVNPQSEEFTNSLKEAGKEYFGSMEKAVDKALLLKDVSDEEIDEMVDTKIQLIQILSNLNNEDPDAAYAKIEAFAAQIRKMDKADIAAKIENFVFRNKIANYVQKGNVDEFAKAAAEVDEKVKKAGKEITPDLAQLALLIVLGGNELTDYKAPEGRNDNYLKALSEAADPEAQRFADVLKTVINQKKDEK